jgi:hypothetical protein
MTKDTQCAVMSFRLHCTRLRLRILGALFSLAMLPGSLGCGSGDNQADPAKAVPRNSSPGNSVPGQNGQHQPGQHQPGSSQPNTRQPALPMDSMVEAMVQIQLAEAYRSRYYVLNAGADAQPPLMDSLYCLALAPLGISPARYEFNYRTLLDRDPVLLQALYDSCESQLQRRLIGLR